MERGAELGAEPPEHGLQLGGVIALDRQAGEADDAGTVLEFLGDLGQQRGQGASREASGAEVRRGEVGRLGGGQRGVEGGDLGRAEMTGPEAPGGELVAAPSGWAADFGKLHGATPV